MSAKNILVSIFEEIYQQYNWAITEHRFEPKQDILVEDDESDDDVYLIRSGKATVIIGGGSEVILGEGDLIGEMSFLLSNKRTASIVAKESVVCWAVSVSSMEKVFSESPPLAARFYKALGALLAMRLVNSSKRAIQNQVFDSNDDALISLMKIQTLDIKDRLQNFVRGLQNELTEQIQTVSAEISKLDVSSDMPFDKRRAEINTLTEQLKVTQGAIYQRVRPKLESFFVEVQHMLMELLDLEKRNEVGANAYKIFIGSILGELPFVKVQGEQSLESVDVILHIFNTHREPELWNARQVVLNWIDQILWEMPTLVAYRARHDLTADIIKQELGTEQEASDITLIYDAIGVVLSQILNTVARIQSDVHMVYTDPRTIYHIQFALTSRMGKLSLKTHRLPSLLGAVIGDEPLLPKDVPSQSQRLLVINGLMNYLPDRYLVSLLTSAKEFLHPQGSILLSGVLPTDDQALFNDFFRWPMIRRSEEELRRMMLALGLTVEIHTRKGGVVVQAQLR